MLKRQPFAVAAVAVSLSAVLVGCGRSRDATPNTEPDLRSTTTTTSPYGEIATIPANEISEPAEVAEVAPTTPRGLDTLEAASQNLWDSWRDDDRERAELYASTRAVDMLFITPWGPEARNQGCGYSNGVARCVYTLRDPVRREIVARVVVIDQTDAGYRVDRVVPVGAIPKANRLDSGLVDDAVVLTDETLPADVVPDIDPGSIPDAPDSGIDPALDPALDPVSDASTPGTLDPSSVDSSVSPTDTIDGSIGSGAPSPVSDQTEVASTNSSGTKVNKGTGTKATGTKATKRRTSKRRTTKPATTTKRKKKKTAANVQAESPSPSPAPEPTPPEPAPSPAPVQIGGQTVDTVG